MTPIYSSANGLTLLKYLQAELQKVIPTEARQKTNIAMLEADMKKFRFVPDRQLTNQGFTLNVKKQILRFPSILLYDLSIIHSCVGHSSWETLDLLHESGHIPSSVYSTLSLLLACACFMRLSAYLTHDSHNDKISVGPRRPVPLQSNDLHVSSPRQRWFVPDCLFCTLCSWLIPLQEYLSTCSDICTKLSTYTHNPSQSDDTLLKISWACGRIADLHVLFELYDILRGYADPESAGFLDIDSEEEYDTEFPAGQIGRSQVEPSDKLQQSLEKQLKRVDYKIIRSEYCQAEKILDKITFHNAEVDYRYGLIHTALLQYDKAEEYLTQALQEFHNQSCQEQLYDYYGDPVDCNEKVHVPEDISTNLKYMPINERIELIGNPSKPLIRCVKSLGDLFQKQGFLGHAKLYYNACSNLNQQLYGERCATYEQADIHWRLGNLAFSEKKYRVAESNYNAALENLHVVYGPSTISNGVHLTCAYIQIRLGIINFEERHDNIRALEMMREALGIIEKVSQIIAGDSDDCCNTSDSVSTSSCDSSDLKPHWYQPDDWSISSDQ